MIINLPKTTPLLFPNLPSPVSEDFTEQDIALFSADVLGSPLVPFRFSGLTTGEAMPRAGGILDSVSLSHDGCVSANSHPLIADLSIMSSVLRRHREQLCMTQEAVARVIGQTVGTYQRLESAERLTSLISGKGQRLSFFLDIRFNYVPFMGEPLSEPQKIFNDLLRRCFMMRLFPKSDEFKDYATIEFQEIKKAVLSGKATQEPFRSILVNKLHMRLMPHSEKRILTAKDYHDLTEKFRAQLAEWNMTGDEAAAWFGVNKSTIEGFLKKPVKFGGFRKRVAALFGYEFEKPKTREQLDSKKYFFPDKTLVDEIDLRLKAMGWSRAKLGEKVGAAPKTMAVIFSTLEADPTDMRSASVRARNTLHQICDVLGISLYILETLPKVRFKFPKDIEQGFRQAVALAKKRRLQLRLGWKDICRDMGLNRSNQTLKLIEAGEINFHNLSLVERYLSAMGIEYDPFEKLEPVQCASIPTSQEFKQLLWQQLNKCPLSTETLDKMTTVSQQERVLYFQGRRALDAVEARKLALSLEIFIPFSDDPAQINKEKWLFDFFTFCHENKLSQRDLMQLGLSQDQIARIRRGEFEMTDPEIVRINIKLLAPIEVLSADEPEKIWAKEVLRRYKAIGSYSNHDTVLPQQDIDRIAKGAFFWNDPKIFFLARTTKYYHAKLIRALSEQYGAREGGLPQMMLETGLIEDQIKAESVFVEYESYQLVRQRNFITLRAKLLNQQLQWQALSPQDEQFLLKTGGSIRDVLRRPLWHLFYLFSLGDIVSPALYCIRQKISFDTFNAGYSDWVQTMYGVTFSAGQKAMRVAGREFLLRNDIEFLGKLVVSLRAYSKTSVVA